MSKTLSECAIEALNLLAQRSQETDNIYELCELSYAMRDVCESIRIINGSLSDHVREYLMKHVRECLKKQVQLLFQAFPSDVSTFAPAIRCLVKVMDD